MGKFCSCCRYQAPEPTLKKEKRTANITRYGRLAYDGSGKLFLDETITSNHERNLNDLTEEIGHSIVRNPAGPSDPPTSGTPTVIGTTTTTENETQNGLWSRGVTLLDPTLTPDWENYEILNTTEWTDDTSIIRTHDCDAVVDTIESSTFTPDRPPPRGVLVSETTTLRTYEGNSSDSWLASYSGGFVPVVPQKCGLWLYVTTKAGPGSWSITEGGSYALSNEYTDALLLSRVTTRLEAQAWGTSTGVLKAAMAFHSTNPNRINGEQGRYRFQIDSSHSGNWFKIAFTEVKAVLLEGDTEPTITETPIELEWIGPGVAGDQEHASWFTPWIELDIPTEVATVTITIEDLRWKGYHSSPWQS